jgi:acyl phosphate:glycerol-3-phosphate acyltransferase
MIGILENIAVALACFAVGYLFGGIPSGVIIGRAIFKKDPRDYGSHNSGGTNSGRVFGKWIGYLVILLDMVKTLAAFYLVWAIIRFSGLREVVSLWDDGVFYTWLAALGAAVGHCWPIYIKFKGGKAVSCFMAIVGGTSWVGFVACAVSFLPLFRKNKIVSYASLISGAILVLAEWIAVIVLFLSHFDSSILMWNFGFGGGLYLGWEMAIVVTATYTIMVIRHRANIERLRNGTEAPVPWAK